MAFNCTKELEVVDRVAAFKLDTAARLKQSSIKSKQESQTWMWRRSIFSKSSKSKGFTIYLLNPDDKFHEGTLQNEGKRSSLGQKKDFVGQQSVKCNTFHLERPTACIMYPRVRVGSFTTWCYKAAVSLREKKSTFKWPGTILYLIPINFHPNNSVPRMRLSSSFPWISERWRTASLLWEALALHIKAFEKEINEHPLPYCLA